MRGAHGGAKKQKTSQHVARRRRVSERYVLREHYAVYSTTQKVKFLHIKTHGYPNPEIYESFILYKSVLN